MKKFWIFLIVLKVWGQDIGAQIENQNRILDLLRKENEQKYIQEQLQYPDKYNNTPVGEIKNFEDNKEYIFKTIKMEIPTKTPKSLLKLLEDENDSLEKQDIFELTQEASQYYFIRGYTPIKPPKTLLKLFKKYENKPLKKQDIFELIKKTSQYYLLKGYTTSIVTIKSGNVKTKELILELKLGYINNIEIKNSKYSKIRVFDAFPTKKNDVLNIHSLDQGLENLNNGGYLYTMQIEPSSRLGYSDILITQNKTGVGISAGLNNSSTVGDGSFRSILGFTQYNLIGINDTLFLTYMERFTHNRNKNKESIYSASYVLPFKYWKFYYSVSYTDSYAEIQGNFGNYNNKSQNLRQTLKIQRVIQRNKTTKTTLYAEARLRGQKNRIDDVLIDLNSKNYTALGFGIEHINKIWGGNLYVDLEYLRGVPILGGERDAKNSVFKAQYNKINLNTSWQKYLYRNRYIGLVYRLNIGASYSNDELYYADKFFIGDQYTVRGFKKSSLALDAGAYLNNTMTLRPLYFQGSIWNFEPFLGLDYGVGRDYGLSHNDQIVGIAAGINYSWKIIAFSLVVSQPLLRSKGMPEESAPIYFNFNIFI